MKKNIILFSFFIILLSVYSGSVLAKERTDKQRQKLLHKALNYKPDSPPHWTKIVQSVRQYAQKKVGDRQVKAALWLIHAKNYKKQVLEQISAGPYRLITIKSIDSFFSSKEEQIAIETIKQPSNLSVTQYLFGPLPVDRYKIMINFHREQGKIKFNRVEIKKYSILEIRNSLAQNIKVLGIYGILFLLYITVPIASLVGCVRIYHRFSYVPYGRRKNHKTWIDQKEPLWYWTRPEIILAASTALSALVWVLAVFMLAPILPGTVYSILTFLFLGIFLTSYPILKIGRYYYPSSIQKSSNLESSVTVIGKSGNYIFISHDKNVFPYYTKEKIKDRKIYQTLGHNILIDNNRKRIGYHVPWDQLPDSAHEYGTSLNL